ncbi:MAG: glycoside hydrolase family 57 protein [bacterium]|nr:glycoside hydrolase family 57 protein [bacterium]
MPSVCFYFQVHQPLRVGRHRNFAVGKEHSYFDDESEIKLNNRHIFQKVSRNCYIPATRVIVELLERHKEFKVSFSFSGIVLEQFERWAPDVLDLFRQAIKTGRVEILGETYYHSLAFLHSKNEFRRQVEMHRAKIKALFGVMPRIFRNTELIYRNDIAAEASALGFAGILAEGANKILKGRSPNFIYRPQGVSNMGILLKNYRLSDDIAFRFSDRSWNEWPLTAPKFTQWLSMHNGSGEVINLFMDYETFGEHQWEESGIFDFLRALPGETLKHPDCDFVTPSEALRRYAPSAALDIPYFVSWADEERDLSAWLSNSMQTEAMRRLYALEPKVSKTDDPQLVEDWRRMQTSDHFYYMCTKWFSDGDVHKYFSPYESPDDAFATYMDALKDLELRVEAVR